MEFALKFTKSVLNDAEKSIVRRAVAFMLSLPLANVLEKQFDVVGKKPFLAPAKSMSLIVAPMYSNANYPDMLSYASFINSAEAKAYILKQLPSFDGSTDATIAKYTLYTPFFVQVGVRLTRRPSWSPRRPPVSRSRRC